MSYDISRYDILKLVKKEFENYPVVVPLAATAREMYSLGYTKNMFITLGSMGMPVSIATGIAYSLSKKEKNRDSKIVCLEGDGSILMSLNSLATIKTMNLNNLIIIALDNETYSVTGNQLSQSSSVDLSAIAESLDFEVLKVYKHIEIMKAIKHAKSVNKTSFIHAKINTVKSTEKQIDIHPSIIKENFHKFLSKY